MTPTTTKVRVMMTMMFRIRPVLPFRMFRRTVAFTLGRPKTILTMMVLFTRQLTPRLRAAIGATSVP